MNQYEAMFLFDPTFGQSFEKCEEEIRRLMERAEAELVFCQKWDERRLAYRIKGRKRGAYVLSYFKASPDKIVSLERDAKLSEHVLRVLIMRADGLSQEHMERALALGREEPARPRREGRRAPDGDRKSRGGEVRARREPESQAVATATAENDTQSEEGESPQAT